MRFYNHQHSYYCGIDRHGKTMSVCILDTTGQVLVHRNVPSTPAAFPEVVGPYRTDVVVSVECMFTWYWLADLCAAEHDQYDALVNDLELTIVREAKRHDGDAFHRLRSVPGIGKVLGLTILYEIHVDGEVPRGVAGRGWDEPHVSLEPSGPSSPPIAPHRAPERPARSGTSGPAASTCDGTPALSSPRSVRGPA